jgi:hypothetical protein
MLIEKKMLSEQARRDKSLSRSIYGSELGNDQVTRNASERRSTPEERTKGRKRDRGEGEIEREREKSRDGEG